jgi:hypothetical protein
MAVVHSNNDDVLSYGFIQINGGLVW